ncbi:hypothetical protein CHU98_g1904 [Xylaria longipes]|nr:hypothetical protein CHU98_g1904 [Xylaria longipes]
MSEPRSDTATQGSAGSTNHNQRPKPRDLSKERLKLFTEDSMFSITARIEAGGPSRSVSDREREYVPIFESVSGTNLQSKTSGLCFRFLLIALWEADAKARDQWLSWRGTVVIGRCRMGRPRRPSDSISPYYSASPRAAERFSVFSTSWADVTLSPIGTGAEQGSL